MDITVASLFKQAGVLLKASFDHVKATNPHSGEKGSEAEDILKTFLNQHLPIRFRAGSGVVIDQDDKVSRQQDVIVYDALSSPIYRYAERLQVIPANAVAAVIEVKSSLTKADLEDSYKKISSAKSLKKRALAPHDRDAGRRGRSDSTNGIVFAFDSPLSLETIAQHMVATNTRYPSDEWPDMVVVVNKGVISYAIQWPGASHFAGWLMTVAMPKEAKFSAPGWFVNLCVFSDEELALNRFFLNLLVHVDAYPLMSGVPPFKTMLDGDQFQAMTITGYQYDLQKHLQPAPESCYKKDGKGPAIDTALNIFLKGGQQVAQLQYLPWQDGGVVRMIGDRMAIVACLSAVNIPEHTVSVQDTTSPGVSLTTILPLKADQFLKWPPRIGAKTPFVAKVAPPST